MSNEWPSLDILQTIAYSIQKLPDHFANIFVTKKIIGKIFELMIRSSQLNSQSNIFESFFPKYHKMPVKEISMHWWPSIYV